MRRWFTLGHLTIIAANYEFAKRPDAETLAAIRRLVLATLKVGSGAGRRVASCRVVWCRVVSCGTESELSRAESESNRIRVEPNPSRTEAVNPNQVCALAAVSH